MNIYSLMRCYRSIKSPRVKLLGILALHLLRRRYLYLAIDPVLGCNLRCRLCYFSDPESEKQMRGAFTETDIDAIADALFHRAIKIQIGCGAEPTVSRLLPDIVRKAKERGIPNISLTTNGQLLTPDRLQILAENGLDELILSVHGLDAETYEHMMRNARYDRFTALLSAVTALRETFPRLRLRINYTVCADNIDSLSRFAEVFSQARPDVVQLRPAQDIGSKAYSDYSMQALKDKYEQRLRPVIDYCRDNGITCLYPEPGNLDAIDSENSRQEHINNVVEMLPYFHLSPHERWLEEFNPYEESFEQYSRRTRRLSLMLRTLAGLKPLRQDEQAVTKALNYDIK